jgi:hypothetical protein
MRVVSFRIRPPQSAEDESVGSCPGIEAAQRRGSKPKPILVRVRVGLDAPAGRRARLGTKILTASQLGEGDAASSAIGYGTTAR